MSKQELIDKAVEDLKGALGGVDWYGATGYDILIKLLSGGYSMAHTDSMAAKGESDNEVICGTSKFTERARELGWINGYKWGEEYPTNGKKPDLPDDVLVKTVDLRGDVRTEKVSFFTWAWYESFIIVDQRYKPADVEMSKSEPEMSKECLNEFPPVGAVVEYKISERCKSHVEITGHGKYGVLIRTMPEGKDETYHYWSAEKNRFRPIKSERDKFVEFITGQNAAGYIVTNEAAKAIYDLVFKFKNKAAL